MDPLKKRLLISSVLVSLTIYAVFFAPFWFFFLIVWGFSTQALNEFFDLASRKGAIINKRFSLLLGALLPFSMLYSAESAVLAFLCLVVFILNFRPDLRDRSLINISVTVFGLVYVSWFFSHLIKIRELEHGAAWVFYVLLVVKGGDAGAYFTGRKLGKRKLLEHISPKKSVEGAIGGLITSVVLAILSRSFLPVSSLHLLVLGFLISILSQLGDLAESLLKRDVGIKDSGNVPGLGGILDVLDSLLLTVPFVYYYVNVIVY